MSDPPIAITGATGFLGSHLVDAFRDRGIPVRAVVRRPQAAARLRETGCEVARADVLDQDALTEAFAGCRAVIANAALGSNQGDLDAMQRVNVQGVENTLRACSVAGVRRVGLVSSVAVYRSRLWRPMAEDAPPTPTDRRRFAWRDLTTDWRYSLTKSRGEALAWRLAGELDLELTALRPGPVYGPRDPKLSARLLQALERSVVFLPTVGLPLVHARDVADAMVAALDEPRSVGRAYNLAGPPVSLARLVGTLGRVAGTGPRVLPIPVPAWVAFDCRRAEAELGFSPRPLEQGLRSLLQA